MKEGETNCYSIHCPHTVCSKEPLRQGEDLPGIYMYMYFYLRAKSFGQEGLAVE